jgi:hypothetical protein
LNGFREAPNLINTSSIAYVRLFGPAKTLFMEN